ncbi:MAG: response regulator, partial [Cyclobacteriaceae bacterium]
MFLEGLASLLGDTQDLEIVGTCKQAKEALDLLSMSKVDLVITDISMPEMNGIALHQYIKRKYPQVRTLVLTTHSQTSMISKLIKQDVNGYLLKNASKEELLTAIYSIASGENFFSEDVKAKYMDSIFAKKKDTQVTLSRREKEVLALIAQEHTTQEIANKLFISQHTVETHRKNMLSKLGARNTAGLVKHA